MSRRASDDEMERALDLLVSSSDGGCTRFRGKGTLVVIVRDANLVPCLDEWVDAHFEEAPGGAVRKLG